MNELPPIQANLVEPATPPPHILHLLLWMGLSAVFLAVDWFSYDRGAGNRWILIAIHRAAIAFLMGAAVSGALILFLWLVQGRSYFSSPGHYFMVLVAAAILLQWCTSLGLEMIRRFNGELFRTPTPFYVGNVVVTSVTMLLGLVGFAFCLRPARWMTVFLVFSGGKAALMLGWMVMIASQRAPKPIPFSVSWVYQGSVLALLGALAVAVAIDMAWRVRRDWMHYAAIGIYVATVIAYWLLQLGLWLTPLRDRP